VLSDFQEHFMSFEPQSQRQNILAAEAYRAFNDLTESRRGRLNSVTDEYRKFQRALLDDYIVFEPVGSADFSHRSSG
jgi:hypothetical protein